MNPMPQIVATLRLYRHYLDTEEFAQANLALERLQALIDGAHAAGRAWGEGERIKGAMARITDPERKCPCGGPPCSCSSAGRPVV